MGWISSAETRARHICLALLLATGISVMAIPARAQIGTGANLYQTLSNGNLILYVGSGDAVRGSIAIGTTAGNPTDPSAILIDGPVLLTGNAIEAPLATPVIDGSRLFVRVDGGSSGGINGHDYIFGRATDGVWLTAPKVVGNHIVAAWQTSSVTVNTNVIDPRIEIDLVATIIHDTVRLQFNIVNNSPGQTHRVGLAFTQDINTSFGTPVGTPQPVGIGAPIRIANGPYLKNETVLAGGQIPPYWELYVNGPSLGGTSNQNALRSIRGILDPGDPAFPKPTRFAFASLDKLNAVNPNPPTGVTGRDFNFLWNLMPDPKVTLIGVNPTPEAVTTFWDEQAVGAGQTVPIVTYLGQATSTVTVARTASLSVTGPVALGFNTLKDANGNPTGVTTTPNPIPISAFVQNLTDLMVGGSSPVPIGPVTLFLDLPKGLILAPGETNPKTILTLGAGAEGAVTWNVVQDPANPTNGQLTYNVTASTNPGSLTAARSVEVPAPAVFNLPGTGTTQGLYKMVSFPLVFGNTTPSIILGLNANQPAPDFDLVRWNPTSGHYEPVNTFLPAFAYWLRSRLTTDKTIVIDSAKYPPLDSQVQPNAVAYKVDYPKGWNQIATPNIYQVRFSEVLVFNPATQTIVDTVTASDPLHNWMQPAVFFYDTSDPNPQNWKYVLEDNFGFEMIPYQGYWIFNKVQGLEFSYPGVDTPGASVTRAALVGVGLTKSSSRGATSDWNLTLQAKGKVSADFSTVIGVTGKATDSLDYYKISKPPTQENQLSLDIVHNDWVGGGRFAKDLRSPAANTKTWNMVLTSSRPNEAVTLSWPNLGISVPKAYHLTLVDTDSNTRYDLRSTSSIALTTNANKTRNIQVIADPTRGGGPAVITSFDIATQPGAPGSSRAVASVSINYTLSQQADTRIEIRTGSGRVLRTLTGQPVTGAGTNSGRAVFDMRDSQGRLISTGVYTAVLTAQSTDGQVSRQVRPFILSR